MRWRYTSTDCKIISKQKSSFFALELPPFINLTTPQILQTDLRTVRSHVQNIPHPTPDLPTAVLKSHFSTITNWSWETQCIFPPPTRSRANKPTLPATGPNRDATISPTVGPSSKRERVFSRISPSSSARRPSRERDIKGKERRGYIAVDGIGGEEGESH